MLPNNCHVACHNTLSAVKSLFFFATSEACRLQLKAKQEIAVLPYHLWHATCNFYITIKQCRKLATCHLPLATRTICRALQQFTIHTRTHSRADQLATAKCQPISTLLATRATCAVYANYTKNKQLVYACYVRRGNRQNMLWRTNKCFCCSCCCRCFVAVN